MADGDPGEYLAECFWPGVLEADLAALDERAAESAAELARQGENVSYLGSLLMREDEVVLCRFGGTESSVRRAAERAAIPFERILAAAGSPWPRRPPLHESENPSPPTSDALPHVSGNETSSERRLAHDSSAPWVPRADQWGSTGNL